MMLVDLSGKYLKMAEHFYWRIFIAIFIFATFISTGSTEAHQTRDLRLPINRGTMLGGNGSPTEIITRRHNWLGMTIPQRRGSHPKRPHPCEQSSCYPATGNLLIGRKNRLTASSTCGLKGPERYCIVSHLKERKKCFFCDASLPKQQHNIENIVDGTNSRYWWQAENGIEYVTIRFDLEAEFHFTHIIIRFQTFRPAAMLIERSFDFGKTWKVYRYFAHNCEQSFPGVATHQPQSLTDVICETRYSGVAPSTGGEVIFRVLPRNLEIDNPYSIEVQNLLKITTLRINMTRLHTLGDDLLDYRPETGEKYYYAIQDMVIRGSCSCYGHASRCLPLPGVAQEENMVHGKCECTHNTKGLNCEKCEDFYNDLPWKPAVGKQTNACRPCNCNNHTSSCHFDETVYERSGRVSGGVCDDCQHNTRGQNCEQCKPFYYHDVSKDISDIEACQPCDCDLSGSLDDGICDSRTDPLSGDESGRCHCKANVEGRRCDHCKNGFWNFNSENPQGCQACTCNTLGTIDNQGCNMITGECTCKRYVTARDCNQCLPGYWGLSEDPDGCKPCDCDRGGSYENSCDVVTGQCRCRPHIIGRTCNQPEQGYYTGSLDFLIYEGELSRATDNCQVVIREPYRDGRNSTWTGTGFMKALQDSTLNFTIDDIRRSMWYDIIVRYEPIQSGTWEDVQIIIERDEPVDLNGPCANSKPEYDRLWVQLPYNSRNSVAQPSVCLEKGKKYNVILQFRKFNSHVDTPTASILIDSIIVRPRIDAVPFFNALDVGELRRQEYELCNQILNDVNYIRNNLPDACKKYQDSIGYYVFEGAHPCECNPTGSHSLLCQNYGGLCPCKVNVVGRRCDRCAPGTYGFGPTGCIPCDCDGVGALDNFCDVKTGRCKCRPNTYGRTCGQCEPGFWNFPHCQRCQCHGHADNCDSRTGACINCRDSTTGHNCDRCIETFYGDPRIGVDIPCRPCPCPGTLDSGHSYADSCSLDSVTQDVICECYEGYGGPRCEKCAENYFGNPEVPGGNCELCECNNNSDLSQPGNCDPHSGHCLQCLYNTDGPNCQICKPGFYGDALKQDCKECNCDFLGSDRSIGPCDHRTGQCPCLPHVIGQRCDNCEENHWRIASGQGCDPCECDAVGSVSDKCNPFDGSCECRAGFGGRRCNECQTNFWGNPNIECTPCECNVIGSSSQQCNRETGVCICHKGIGGEKCDQCDRGYHGEAPQCSPCGECFDNWDLTLDELKNKTNLVIEEASRIQKVGTTGVYSQEFDDMVNSLNQVRDLISNTSIKSQDLDELTDLAEELSKNISNSAKQLEEVDNMLENVSQRVNLGDVALKKLKNRTNSLHQGAMELKENATILQEENVQGALNVTQQMAEQSRQAEKMANATSNILADAERYRKHTENLLIKNSVSFNEAQERNNESLLKLSDKLNTLNEDMPELNLKMCGDNVTDCSNVCGGAGCGFCGGLSCDIGAITKANQALDVAKQQADKIKNQKDEAEQLLRNMIQIKQDAVAARSNAQDAFNNALEARNRSDKITKSLSDTNKRIWSMLDEEQPTPTMVRDLANDILNKNIKLKPDEIKRLASRIKTIVGSLTDSDKILADTKDDLELAHNLEESANQAKDTALKKQNETNEVVLLLTEAKKAQELAKAAIDTAQSDVAKSEKDLTDIAVLIKEAQTKANDTTDSVKALDTRLKQLQKQSAKNAFILNKEIEVETLKVANEARVVEGKTKKLAEEYKKADEFLNYRINKSEDDIKRAKKLLQRASELTADTSTKFKDLDGMESVYKDNERILTDLMAEIDSLTVEMVKHLAEIERKAQIYRQCTS
ncbi:laminin subunit beta-1-like isoform X1 [Vespa mandarinia]|uniref:laminin subunit beta-1-like isoform X1 n=1 Tax=Vespa mandarinia TaxID=7446 RepID=UPI00161ED80B|nr:laminin subunit beta-1-like isoform X1 [Vespa mandarinia]XP_035719160.1 laminin subunit beta-1-like isoform X1 [Vespa mandarinia]XP_035719161.1 laminin subunit beta-1-like isoform X1 [Vespa mandarinia]XP_035719162.1 laminin subunit beta-1-like isoform X1 [Vespa mandarinia]